MRCTYITWKVAYLIIIFKKKSGRVLQLFRTFSFILKLLSFKRSQGLSRQNFFYAHDLWHIGTRFCNWLGDESTIKIKLKMYLFGDAAI